MTKITRYQRLGLLHQFFPVCDEQWKNYWNAVETDRLWKRCTSPAQRNARESGRMQFWTKPCTERRMQRSASMLQVKERHGSDGSCCRHVFFFPASLERVWNAYVQTRRRLCGVSRKTATKGVRTTIVQTPHRQPPCNPRTMHRRRQRGHDLEQDRTVSDVKVSDEMLFRSFARRPMQAPRPCRSEF